MSLIEVTTGVLTASCVHEWHRAPERDRTKGADQAVLVFWCSKCLAVETRSVSYEAEKQ